MQSFRTEIENPIVEKDILELEHKIRLFREGKVDEEKFRSLRLARGVYGQRQEGVQMIRIKIPYGKLSGGQLKAIADLSDEYSNGWLHATTRQDIQIHYVSLDRTPELWAKLEASQITLREACGNTVRNITASDKAGVDPHEPFDVSPYAQRMFEYFLRNPICQEMGRKFKIALSSSAEDSAFAFIHDIGLIPKINDQGQRGFEVWLGGGLGAVPFPAQQAYEFLPSEEIIPFAEATLRVFDRHGERQRRMKARFKFLLKELGMEEVMRLIEEERSVLANQKVIIDQEAPKVALADHPLYTISIPEDWQEDFQHWKATNSFKQKQAGFFGAYIKLPLGNMNSDTARKLATIAAKYGADELRVTVNQGYQLRFIKEGNLPALYLSLRELGLAGAGFDSTADITACPGTDTCNLGISSSTGIAKKLEDVILKEYPEMIYNQDIKIKISGCPNACGQHTIASVGFHGSSLKKDGKVLPALQVLLGGAVNSNGTARMADKVIKVPSKRAPQALRVLFEDFDRHQKDGEYYADYYQRQGKMYFYQLLKPLADLESVQDEEYLDWGHQAPFLIEKAVGECAGVIIDLVSTLVYETEEKGTWAKEALEEGRFPDALYHSYNVFVNGAKALLLSEGIETNTQISVLELFDEHVVSKSQWNYADSFKDHVLRIKKEEASEAFVKSYHQDAMDFLVWIKKFREQGQTVQTH